MKNIYLYGASDDLHEVETDFDRGHEGYGDVLINDVRAAYSYDGDWKIKLYGTLPPGWKVRKIEGTSDFVHIQVPDDAEVTFKDVEEAA
ncbi:MAG: hypothetical protein M3R02_00195 [Chloroflexota bacterium]|nr:hypothetical protein [Chloroflexota bacterium]